MGAADMPALARRRVPPRNAQRRQAEMMLGALRIKLALKSPAGNTSAQLAKGFDGLGAMLGCRFGSRVWPPGQQ